MTDTDPMAPINDAMFAQSGESVTIKRSDLVDVLTLVFNLRKTEQEARKNFMTADGKVVLDPYQTVYKVSVYPDCANPLGFIGGHPAYQAIYNDSSLAGYYSTVEAAEAALAAAKGTT